MTRHFGIENPYRKIMRKEWRNQRQILVRQAVAEPEDARRVERLVSLLATGVERLLAQDRGDSPEPVDFPANALPNVCDLEETAKGDSV